MVFRKLKRKLLERRHAEITLEKAFRQANERFRVRHQVLDRARTYLSLVERDGVLGAENVRKLSGFLSEHLGSEFLNLKDAIDNLTDQRYARLSAKQIEGFLLGEWRSAEGLR